MEPGNGANRTTYTTAVPVSMTGSSVFTKSSNGVVMKPTELHSTLTVPCSKSVPTTYLSVVHITDTSRGLPFTTSTTVVVIGTPTTASGEDTEPWAESGSPMLTSNRSRGYTTSPTSFNRGFGPESSDKNPGSSELVTAGGVYESSEASQSNRSESSKYATSEGYKTGTATAAAGTASMRALPIINGAVRRSYTGLLASLVVSVYLLLL